MKKANKKSRIGYMKVHGFYQLKFSLTTGNPPRLEIPCIFRFVGLWKRLKKNYKKVKITIEEIE